MPNRRKFGFGLIVKIELNPFVEWSGLEEICFYEIECGRERKKICRGLILIQYKSLPVPSSNFNFLRRDYNND